MSKVVQMAGPPTACPSCHQSSVLHFIHLEDNRWLKYPAIAFAIFLVWAWFINRDPMWFCGTILLAPLALLSFLRTSHSRGEFRQCQSCGYRWQV